MSKFWYSEAIFNEGESLMFGKVFDVGGNAFELFIFLLEYRINAFLA